MFNQIKASSWKYSDVVNRLISRASQVSDRLTKLNSPNVQKVLQQAEDAYVSAGANFYTILPQKKVCDLSSDDMTWIYENRFAHELSNGTNLRKDYLKLFSAHQKCPVCGANHAGQLDHVLPKSVFPQFALTPINLVPMCAACNQAKGTTTSDEAITASFHPFFEDFSKLDGLHFDYKVGEKDLVCLNKTQISNPRLLSLLNRYTEVEIALTAIAAHRVSRLIEDLHLVDKPNLPSKLEVEEELRDALKQKHLEVEERLAYQDALVQINAVAKNIDAFCEFV